MKEGWFRSYVEQILEEAWEQCRVAADDDGDYPYRVGTAACFVRVDQGPPLHVRVWGYAATDVRRTAKLLIELNDFNAAARSVRAYWANGAVIVEDAVLAGGGQRRDTDPRVPRGRPCRRRHRRARGGDVRRADAVSGRRRRGR